MIKVYKIGLYFCSIALLGGVSAMPAYGQATRTWVSGVGDDANPCSRTAPCKTFAGAISKTAAGGEINCLDPAGYGAVTITKAMTINCIYTEGGVLAAGNGIVVSAGASDVIFLRGLDFFGVNPPTHGVRILTAGAVHIEDSTIRRFNATNSFGVSFQPSGATQLYISRTTIADNGSGATGGGILIQPTGASGSANVQLTDVSVRGNAGTGLRVDTTGDTNVVRGISVTIERSEFVNGADGINVVVPASTSAAQVLVNGSVVSNNSGTGLAASGSANASMRVSTTTITGNGVGVSASGGAALNSFGDNRLVANANNGAFNGGIVPHS